MDDAEGSALGSECAMAERSYVTMDRYALADMQRAHRLKHTPAFVLDALVRLVSYRAPHVWDGTLYELAEFTTISRGALTAALDRLVAEGLIAVHDPFKSRRSGLVEVLVYDDLVVPPRRSRRGQSETYSRSNRRIGAADQPIAESDGGSEAVRAKGGVDARESLTREDWPALGAYRKNTKAFPGASETGT